MKSAEKRIDFVISGRIKDPQLLGLKCGIIALALAAMPGWAADIQSGIDDFNPNVGFPGYVSTIALQADGKVVVGGLFSMVGGQPRTNLARVHPDGSLDQ